jgi:hypothetical protein
MRDMTTSANSTVEETFGTLKQNKSTSILANYVKKASNEAHDYLISNEDSKKLFKDARKKSRIRSKKDILNLAAHK